MDDNVVVAFFSAYSLIFIFGLIGNQWVIYSALRHRSNRTVVNVLMSNLAVANILFCLFIVPIAPTYLVTKSWPFGSSMCHVVECVYYTACYASMLTLTSIVTFVYWIIVHSLAAKMKRMMLIANIVLVWLVPLAFSLPHGILVTQIEYRNVENIRVKGCFLQWPTISDYNNYSISTLAIMFCLPFVFIVYCLIAMSMRLSRMSTADNATRLAVLNRRKLLLIIMVTVLAICWLPIHIYRVTLNTNTEIYRWKHMEILFRVLQVMEHSSTCVTPMFYVWLNKTTIKQILVLLCGQRSDHQSDHPINEEADNVDTAPPTYEEAITYNGGVASATAAHMDAVEDRLPTYEEAVTDNLNSGSSLHFNRRKQQITDLVNIVEHW